MKRTVKYGFALLGIVALAVGYRTVTSRWDFWIASGELPDALAKYRAAGLPWTAADIHVPVAPESNAAGFLHHAIQAMPENRPYPSRTSDLSGYSRALEKAHTAAQRPQLDFGRDWDQGAAVPMPELAEVREICKALAARAEQRAARGDDPGAIRDLEDIRRLAQLIGSEPSVISALVGVSCDRRAMQGARDCLAHVAKDRKRIVRYRNWLAKPTPLFDLNYAFRGELYLSATYVRNLDKWGVGQEFSPENDVFMFSREEDPEPPTVRRKGLPENTRSRAYLARFLQMWTEIARTTHGLKDPVDSISLQSEAMVKRYEKSQSKSYAFSTMLISQFTQFGRVNLTTLASRRVTLALADAMLLHAQIGKWPTSVKVADPLGKDMLKVRFDGKRFRIWSVGRNGKDDGGLFARETTGRASSSDDDIAAYPAVPPASRSATPPSAPDFDR